MKFFYSLALCLLTAHIIHASAYGPSLLFHKPYNTTPYASHIYLGFSGGTTTQGYDRHGQTVPFLQEYGSEDLLARFLDHTVPVNDITKLGTMKFAGTLNFERLSIGYSKNIHRNCFIGIGTVVQNVEVDNITPTITLTSTLTPKQEHALDILKSKIPNTITSSGIFTTALEFGYNRIFHDFTSINFLQLYLKGAFGIPQIMHGNNFSILQYPLAGNISFSYPVVATILLGLHKHINFGFFNAMIPFQPRQVFAPVNPTLSHNNIVVTELAQIIVSPKPVFSSTMYIELYNFVDNLMLTMGYGSATGLPWKIHAIDQGNFPDPLINSNELLNGFAISSLFLQADYSFKSEKHPYGPAISISYVAPISGRYFPKLATVNGAFGLAIHTQF